MKRRNCVRITRLAWLWGTFVVAALSLVQRCGVPQEPPERPRNVSASRLPLIESHLDKIIASGRDVFGPVQTRMWCANMDTRTGAPLGNDHIPQRAYRLIGAPGGSTLYWDQPLAAAACRVSEITGKTEYRETVETYVSAFLERCVDERGVFAWGNHMYYDVFADSTVRFSGGYHELRPMTPAWDLFWRQDSLQCAKYIRTMTDRHVFDRNTGGFNRHDDGKEDLPFLEAGAVLVESLAWLYARDSDPELLSLALRIAEYSYARRGEATGLLRTTPGSERWDDFVHTTESGVWAQSLLRAAEYTGNERFAEMAGAAMRAYLQYGYDADARQFYGQLSIHDGSPVVPTKKGYWPGQYADIWNIDQWPTHDYPMSIAEACVTLYLRTRDPVFRTAVQQWVEVIRSRTPAQHGVYADQYGRCIHFLIRAARMLEDETPLHLAQTLADEAVDCLYENGMFQGMPETHTYEAIDGVGVLCLALIDLEQERESSYLGFGF